MLVTSGAWSSLAGGLQGQLHHAFTHDRGAKGEARKPAFTDQCRHSIAFCGVDLWVVEFGVPVRASLSVLSRCPLLKGGCKEIRGMPQGLKRDQFHFTSRLESAIGLVHKPLEWKIVNSARLNPIEYLIETGISCESSFGRSRINHWASMEGPMRIGPSVHALRHSWTLESNPPLSMASFQASHASDQQLWLPVSFPMPPAERPTSLPASLFQFPTSDSSSSDFTFSSGVQPQIRGPGARLEKINEFHDESSEYDTDSSSDGQESLFSESSEGTLSMPVRPLPSAASLEALTMLEVEQSGTADKSLSETLWGTSMKLVAQILYHPLMLCTATASLSQLAFQAFIADQMFVLRQLTAMLEDGQLTAERGALIQLQSKLQGMIMVDRSLQLQAEPSRGAQAIAATFCAPSAPSLASGLAVLKVRAWAAANLSKAWGEHKDGCTFHTYVAAFAAEDVQSAVVGLEAYLDTHASGALPSDIGAIKEAYAGALSLEFDLLTDTQALYCAAPQPGPAPFFSEPAPGPVPVVFATDFDVTCTLEDSSETLMHLAAAAAGAQAEQACRETGGSADECAVAWEEAAMGVRSRWDHVLERYSKNLQAVIEDILNPMGEGKAAKLPPAAMDITLPEPSSLGLPAPIDVPVPFAAPMMQIELPSPSTSSEPSESPRFPSLHQAASQPNLASFGASQRNPIARSPSEPSELGQRLKAPSRAFDIDSGAAVPGMSGEKRPFDPEGLRAALERLGALEGSTNTEVEAAGVLRGVTADKVFAAAAQEVKVRPHVGSLLTRVQRETGQPIHALSANWSADLIKGALSSSIAAAGGAEQALLVHSNNLAFDAHGVSSGMMRRAVVSAPDKLRVLEGLVAGTFASDPAFQSREALPFAHSEVGHSGRRPFTIYLGDGITDLLALLAADLGIVVGHSFSLRKICAAYGVTLRPLVAASVEMSRLTARDSWSGRWNGVLYETSGWEEVEACIFGSVRD